MNKEIIIVTGAMMLIMGLYMFNDIQVDKYQELAIETVDACENKSEFIAICKNNYNSRDTCIELLKQELWLRGCEE